MLSANQIAGFFNRLYLQKEIMEKLDFLHVDTNLSKLKVDKKTLEWAWSKMGVAIVVSEL